MVMPISKLKGHRRSKVWPDDSIQRIGEDGKRQ
jgi:hypothetical protein